MRWTDRLRGRGAFLALLAATGVLFTWRLSISGFANAYYSAAAQAGAQNWTAFFFGSLDASNAITVDKPPLGLWPMDLSVRLFGLNPWSILLPQAVEGVAATALVYACVRRMTGTEWSAVLGGALFAFTPVTVLIFRYNNPDALLTLLLLGAAYAVLRAVDGPHNTGWLTLAGGLVGLGFLTKMLEALLVVPALWLTFLVYGPGRLPRKCGQLVVASVALVAAAGWWVSIVELWPHGQRPFIGGSPTNSVLELAAGYNGVTRIVGRHPATSMHSLWAATNVARIGRTDLAGETGWIVPAAVVLFVMSWIIVRKRHITALLKPGLFLWGIWAAVTSLTFALMAGIFHSYYTVIVAPAVAAAVATGIWVGWTHRHHLLVRLCLYVALVLTMSVELTILVRLEHGVRWWMAPILLTGAPALAWLHFPRMPHRHTIAMAAAAILACLAGPTIYDWATINEPHNTAGPTAGPGHGSETAELQAWSRGSPNGTMPAGFWPITPGVIQALSESSDQYRWVAAAAGARSAAAYQLATGRPVLAIGGYKGADPWPTIDEFTHMVARDEIHWYVPGGTYGPTTDQIQAWVSRHYPTTIIEGRVLYDLTEPEQLQPAELQ